MPDHHDVDIHNDAHYYDAHNRPVHVNHPDHRTGHDGRLDDVYDAARNFVATHNLVATASVLDEPAARHVAEHLAALLDACAVYVAATVT